MKDSSPNTNYIRKWEKGQTLMNAYLEEILLRIEWHYGDCRAPFRFPPDYSLIYHDDKIVEYVSVITLDLGEAETVRYSATNPENLFEMMKKDIDEKYGIK